MTSSKVNDVLKHRKRLTDVVDEPRRMLPPIQGYEQLPLVSIEEAVQPLVNDIPKIEQYASDAKKRCTSPPADGLTIDESASIRLYTMESEPHEKSLYFCMNKALRDANRIPLRKYLSYLKLLITALYKIPSNYRRLFRGVKLSLLAEHPQGEITIWWAFSSCAGSVEVLENPNLVGQTGDRTLFEIDCYSAKDIRNHSYFSNENELLLIAATQFTIVSSLDMGNGLRIVKLKETKPKFLLRDEPLTVGIDQVDCTLRTGGTSTSKPKPPKSEYISMETDPDYHNENLERHIGSYQLHGAVNLNDRRLTDKDMRIVAEKAINDRQCTKLCLSYNKITSHGISTLVDAIRESTTLEELDLSNNQLSDVDIYPLLTELRIDRFTPMKQWRCCRVQTKVSGMILMIEKDGRISQSYIL